MMGLLVSDYAASGSAIAAVSQRLSRAGVEIESEWPQVLRSLRPGSAGVVVCIAGYEPYVPRAGSGSRVVDLRAPEQHSPSPERQPFSTYRQTLAMSAAEQMREVLAALALNKSQLADVLGVTRPTLYDWLDGREPNPANAERLSAIVRILARSSVTSASALNARFVRRPLEEGGPSLLEELKASSLDEERINRLLEDARKLSAAADARREGREERLRRLGYEEPSDQERRERLGRNVASLDWPKR
jgi:DNA-binding transcriptional regulator YiaG